MRRWQTLFAVVPLIAMLGMPANAAVTVTFVHPELFTDADDTSGNSARTLLEIAGYLKALGNRYLAVDDTLKIDILDIDLAGEIRLSRMGTDARYCTGEADWPRIDVRYALVAKDGIARSGEETIVDRVYLRRLRESHPPVSLPYEKRMLDEWFKTRFVDERPTP